MKYAIIDTETSGLFDFSKPADAEGQPRLAHIAMFLINEDGEITREIDLHINPDGWSIDPESEAARVNGLTQDFLEKHGVPVSEVLDEYNQIIDDGYVIAAYNAQFDTKVMRAELRLADRDDKFETTPNICLMRACVDICKIPKMRGRGWKFPKLIEACEHFKVELSGAHNARNDAMAALEIFRKLKELDALPAPKVHFAKNKPEPIS